MEWDRSGSLPSCLRIYGPTMGCHHISLRTFRFDAGRVERIFRQFKLHRILQVIQRIVFASQRNVQRVEPRTQEKVLNGTNQPVEAGFEVELLNGEPGM